MLGGNTFDIKGNKYIASGKKCHRLKRLLGKIAFGMKWPLPLDKYALTMYINVFYKNVNFFNANLLKMPLLQLNLFLHVLRACNKYN